MKCYNCNAIIDKEDALYCSKCGSDILINNDAASEVSDSADLAIDPEFDDDIQEANERDVAAYDEEPKEKDFEDTKREAVDFNYVYEGTEISEPEITDKGIKGKKRGNKKSIDYSEPFLYASFFSRFCALFLDTFLISTAFGFLLSKNVSDEAISLLSLLLALVVFPLFESKFKGSPGKWIMRIKVVLDNSYENITFKRALMRNILKTLSVVTIIGIFWPLLNKKKQALHDFITRCVLIRN